MRPPPLPPEFREFLKRLRTAAPQLTVAVEHLISPWLKALALRLDNETLPTSSKIFNDPVWGSIILHPAEILLLDSPLLQRLRGIRQLGLAHYVFPGAVYDRLEHTRGVVEGAQRILTALDSSIAHTGAGVPKREPSEVEAIRLGALLHDIGHGPFSHATEDLIHARYRRDIDNTIEETLRHYDDVIKIQPAEQIAILMIISQPLLRVLTHSRFPVSNHESLPARIIGSLIGSSRYLSGRYLAGIVSGPIDADKLDYMARDSHHAGLTLGLETDRLLSQLQVALVTSKNAPPETKSRIDSLPGGFHHDLAISRAGMNAYEQMIIGRAILFDRVYYHHKVRVAEAMVRRLIELSEKERGHPYDVAQLIPQLTDEAFICVLGGILGDDNYAPATEQVHELADRIRFRRLYHRAFAFSTRFLEGLDALPEGEKDDTKTIIGTRIMRIAAAPDLAENLEAEIAGLAARIHQCMHQKGDPARSLSEDEVIVDLPQPGKVSLRGQDMLVVSADGHLEMPNLYFDPMKWAQAYSVNKLCGFVFCPEEWVRIVNLAAKIVFAETLGIVVSEAADRHAKVPRWETSDLMDRLVTEQILSPETREQLRKRETRFAAIEGDDVRVPESWIKEGRNVPAEIARVLNTARPTGFTHSQKGRICQLIEGLCTFYDVAYSGGRLKEVRPGQESLLQAALRDHLRSQGHSVTEAQRISGGQQDLLFDELITIENKIHPEPTDSPLNVGEKYPWQARRYSIPTSSEIVATVVGYIPRSERGHQFGWDSIAIRRLEGESTVEIRLAVPVGYTSPSAAKVPPDTMAG